jgi:hypothetical protein
LSLWKQVGGPNVLASNLNKLVETIEIFLEHELLLIIVEKLCGE